MTEAGGRRKKAKRLLRKEKGTMALRTRNWTQRIELVKFPLIKGYHGGVICKRENTTP